MRNALRCFVILLTLLMLPSCSKENPTPEELDPIFKDLEKRATDAQKSYDEEIGKQHEVEQKIEKADPNTLAKKNAEKDLAKSKNIALEQQQWARYYKIRAERRKLVDHLTYKEALNKGSPWPDPHEYTDYQVNLRLREAPRNWGVHVPKLQDRITNIHAKAAEKPKE